MKKQNAWTLTNWDGNPDLRHMCWRKKFGRGHVSVGCGDFLHIVHSFGADSDNSYSGTRWRAKGPISEQEAMALVDKQYS